MLTAMILLAAAAHCKADPKLAKEASVTCEAARETARRRVPKGRVKSAELEIENGKLVWSFDLKQKGKQGVEEVQVDAGSGEIISVKHEDAATEAAEQRKEK